MSLTKTILAILGLIGVMVITNQRQKGERIEKPLPSVLNDLQRAQVIEIRDATGSAALTGTFAIKADTPTQIEREAALAGALGAGSAEIEISRKNAQIGDEELELKLEKLAPTSGYKIIVDNKEVLAFITDRRGKANLKLSSKIPTE